MVTGMPGRSAEVGLMEGGDGRDDELDGSFAEPDVALGGAARGKCFPRDERQDTDADQCGNVNGRGCVHP